MQLYFFNKWLHIVGLYPTAANLKAKVASHCFGSSKMKQSNSLLWVLQKLGKNKSMWVGLFTDLFI